MYALSSMEQLVAFSSPMRNVASSWRAEASIALAQSAGTEVVEERAGTEVLVERAAGAPARRESAVRRPWERESAESTSLDPTAPRRTAARARPSSADSRRRRRSGSEGAGSAESRDHGAA
uniref:Uncharacterized protein n=1 Tax=Arundo donax TaxID=35708 RepID=A0A0A9PH63_ARUDO